jgi:hypothetical protein
MLQEVSVNDEYGRQPCAQINYTEDWLGIPMGERGNSKWEKSQQFNS